MKQKCPNCGRWCEGEHQSFLKRADKEFEKTANNFGEFGAAVGGLFGKRGENFGRKAGAFLSGATNIATVKATFGGLTGNEFSFQCPNCGYCWEASDATEDQIEEASQDYQRLISSIQESLQNNDYDTALKLSKEVSELHYGEGMYWSARTKRSKAKFILSEDFPEEEREQRFDEHNMLIESGLKDIEACEQYYISEEDDPIELAWAVTEKGWLFTEKSNRQARKWFMIAMQSPDDSVRDNAKLGYEYATDKVMNVINEFVTIEDQILSCLNDADDWSQEDKDEFANMVRQQSEEQKFCNIEKFSDRQFIFIVKDEDHVAGCYDMDDNINWVFTQDALPADISFPVGHPIPNTLYIAHPAQKGLYLPYEGAEDVLFQNKVEEFCRLAQCLGAEEITFSSIQGKSVSQNTALSYDANINGGRKKLNASGATSCSDSLASDMTTSKEVGLSFTYKPTKSPYCPTDITWLDVDSSWQAFVRQRLEGNILSYTKRISSTETTNISSNKKRGVKASFESLMNNVDGNFDSSVDTTFSSSENTIWEISIKFKSIDEFHDESNSSSQNKSTLQLSAAEQKYKEEVLFVLEDGVIGDAERRLLERKRQKFGISEERAKLIEEICTPSLSEEEKEYIEIYKDMLEDGEISERRRKILNKEAESLGISQSRAVELEAMN